MISLDNQYFTLLPEVDQALRGGKPVVALESTVITHGLPYPVNVQLAREMEDEIRKQGCVPATIAIIDGKICIGLNAAQLDQLVGEKTLLKISMRDIAPAVQHGRSGGTTVAGTLALAAKAGIKVFATGGIGGVHRGAVYDISADLTQLARSQLIVVCAGAKAILDIPATLELLETYGVPVVGYQTDEFPAFYSTSSGFMLSVRADSAEDVAQLAKIHWELGMVSSILVTVPPPFAVALEREQIESAIKTGLEELKDKQIHGQAVTPYLLGRVSELTGGMSLQTNLGLLLNNARVAGEIARFL